MWLLSCVQWAQANPGRAWGLLREAYPRWRIIMFIDARRILSILWNSFLTIPVPYLGVMKLLDFALCVPVYLFEHLQGKACLQRSAELMAGNRLLLLKTALYLALLGSGVAGVVIGLFMVFVPTLPSILVASPDVAEYTIGETAQGIFTGTAFDRVWEVGTTTEKTATVLLLLCAVAASFITTLAVRQLVYVFHREVSARWEPPPPPEPEDETTQKKGFLRRLQFWRKDDDKPTEKDAGSRVDDEGMKDPESKKIDTGAEDSKDQKRPTV